MFQYHKCPKAQYTQMWRLCDACILLFQCWEDQIKLFFSVVEVAHACFSTKNVHKYNFHNCRGCTMPVDSGFSAGKIR